MTNVDRVLHLSCLVWYYRSDCVSSICGTIVFGLRNSDSVDLEWRSDWICVHSYKWMWIKLCLLTFIYLFIYLPIWECESEQKHWVMLLFYSGMHSLHWYHMSNKKLSKCWDSATCKPLIFLLFTSLLIVSFQNRPTLFCWPLKGCNVSVLDVCLEPNSELQYYTPFTSAVQQTLDGLSVDISHNINSCRRHGWTWQIWPRPAP